MQVLNLYLKKMIGCENNAKKTFCFDFLFLSNLSMVGLKANNFNDVQIAWIKFAILCKIKCEG